MHPILVYTIQLLPVLTCYTGFQKILRPVSQSLMVLALGMPVSIWMPFFRGENATTQPDLAHLNMCRCQTICPGVVSRNKKCCRAEITQKVEQRPP